MRLVVAIEKGLMMATSLMPARHTPTQKRAAHLRRAREKAAAKARERVAKASGIVSDYDVRARKVANAQVDPTLWSDVLDALRRRIGGEEMQPEHRARLNAAASLIVRIVNRVRRSGRQVRDMVICTNPNDRTATVSSWRAFAARVRRVGVKPDGKTPVLLRAPKGHVAVALLLGNEIVVVAVRIAGINLRSPDYAIGADAMSSIVEWRGQPKKTTIPRPRQPT